MKKLKRVFEKAYGDSFWLREIKSHSITFIGKLDHLVDIPIGYVGSNINEGLKTVMLVIEKLLLSVTFSILAPNCSIPLLPSREINLLSGKFRLYLGFAIENSSFISFR